MPARRRVPLLVLPVETPAARTCLEKMRSQHPDQHQAAFSGAHSRGISL